jgi:putative membrane protein
MNDRAAHGEPRLNVTTTLAFERTRIAYERTMMAWIRTATSLITFGFSVYKFFQFELKNGALESSLISPREFGLALICIGLLSLVAGIIDHGRDLRALRRQYSDMPRTMSSLVAIVVGALGLVALAAVILRA